MLTCVCVCEIIGSKKEPHQPVEQQRSLPQDEDEKEVGIVCTCVCVLMCVCPSVCMCTQVCDRIQAFPNSVLIENQPHLFT